MNDSIASRNLPENESRMVAHLLQGAVILVSFLLLTDVAGEDFFGIPQFKYWAIIFFLLAIYVAIKATDRPSPLLRRDERIALTIAVTWIAFEMSFFLFKPFHGSGYVFKVHIVSAVVFFLLYGLVSIERYRKAAVLGALTGILATTAVALIQTYVADILSNPFVGRSTGLADIPNSFALSVLMGFLAILGYLPEKRRIPFAFLCGAGIFASFSRTEMLAFGGAIPFLLISGALPIRPYWRVVRQSIVMSAVLTAFFFGAYLSSSPFFCAYNSQIGQFPASLEKLAGVFQLIGSQNSGQTVAGDPDLEMARTKGVSCDARRNLLVARYKEGPVVGPVIRAIESVFAITSRQAASVDSREIEFRVGSHSFDTRIYLMTQGISMSLKYPWLGIDSIEDAGNNSGHNTSVFFALSYGLVGLLIIPAFCGALSCLGNWRLVVPFSVAILLLAIGRTDPLMEWGMVLLPAALIAAFPDTRD